MHRCLGFGTTAPLCSSPVRVKQAIVVKSATVKNSPRYHSLKFDPWAGGPSETLTWSVPRKYLTIVRESRPQDSTKVQGKKDRDARLADKGAAGPATVPLGQPAEEEAESPVASTPMLTPSISAADMMPAPEGNGVMQSEARELAGAQVSQGATEPPVELQVSAGKDDRAANGDLSTTTEAAPLKDLSTEEPVVAPAVTILSRTTVPPAAPITMPMESRGGSKGNEDADAEASSSARTREFSNSDESSVRRSRTRGKSSKLRASPSKKAGSAANIEISSPRCAQEGETDQENADKSDGAAISEPRAVAEDSVGDAVIGSPMSSRPAYPVGTVVVVRRVDTDPGRSLKFARGETVEAGFHELLGREVRHIGDEGSG